MMLEAGLGVFLLVGIICLPVGLYLMVQGVRELRRRIREPDKPALLYSLRVSIPSGIFFTIFGVWFVINLVL